MCNIFPVYVNYANVLKGLQIHTPTLYIDGAQDAYKLRYALIQASKPVALAPSLRSKGSFRSLWRGKTADVFFKDEIKFHTPLIYVYLLAQRSENTRKSFVAHVNKKKNAAAFLRPFILSRQLRMTSDNQCKLNSGNIALIFLAGGMHVQIVLTSPD